MTDPTTPPDEPLEAADAVIAPGGIHAFTLLNLETRVLLPGEAPVELPQLMLMLTGMPAYLAEPRRFVTYLDASATYEVGQSMVDDGKLLKKAMFDLEQQQRAAGKLQIASPAEAAAAAQAAQAAERLRGGA